MKTTKEYPATHSMSTAWFIADADGNVGAFEFDENGPVPFGVNESSFESLIEIDFVTPDEDGFPTFEMTEEQLSGISERLRPIDANFDFIRSVVKIDVVNETRFRSLVKKEDCVCLSRKLGLYIISYWDDDKYKGKKLRDLVLEHMEFDVWNSNEWNDGKVEYEHYPDDLLPFYLYQQPYRTDKLTERTIIPTHPFKEEQFPKQVRKKLLHIPVLFADYTFLQIAEFFPSKMYQTEDTISIHDAQYSLLRKSDGEKAYICTDSLIFSKNTTPNSCKKCEYKCSLLWNLRQPYTYPDFDLDTILYAEKPTIALVIDKNEYTTPSNLSKYLMQLPFIMGVPRKINYNGIFASLCDNDIERYAEKCREMFEYQLNHYHPYVLIFNENIKAFLSKHYVINTETITIGDKQFHYFMADEIESRETEILALAQQPYRGIRKPHIVSKEEMEKWKQAGKEEEKE